MTGQEFLLKRQSLCWTQKSAAERLGLSIAQISAIENGRSRVTRTVERLIGLYRPFDREDRPTGWMTDAQWNAYRGA